MRLARSEVFEKQLTAGMQDRNSRGVGFKVKGLGSVPKLGVPERGIQGFHSGI